MISATGIWSEEEARQSGYPKSHILAHKLAGGSIFNPSEIVIDLGCGDGYYMLQLLQKGYLCLGYDGFIPQENFVKTNWLLRETDLSQSIHLKPRGQILCLEVGEHIPVQYEQIFIDNLCFNCNSRLVLSWAIQGQNGIGHVNCRNNDYVINQIELRGLKFNDTLTKYLRKDIENDVRYFADTLLVFDIQKY